MIFLLPRWDMLVSLEGIGLYDLGLIPPKNFPRRNIRKGTQKFTDYHHFFEKNQPTHPTFHGPNLWPGLHAVLNRYPTLPTASWKSGTLWIHSRTNHWEGVPTWPLLFDCNCGQPQHDMCFFWQWLKSNTNPDSAVLNNLQHNWSSWKVFLFFRVANLPCRDYERSHLRSN